MNIVNLKKQKHTHYSGSNAVLLLDMNICNCAHLNLQLYKIFSHKHKIIQFVISRGRIKETCQNE